MSRSNIESRWAQCSEKLITAIETFKRLSKRSHIIPPAPFQTLISSQLQTVPIEEAISQCNNTKLLLDEGIKILSYEKRRRNLCEQLDDVTEIVETKEEIKAHCRTAKIRRIDMSQYLKINEPTSSNNPQVRTFFKRVFNFLFIFLHVYLSFFFLNCVFSINLLKIHRHNCYYQHCQLTLK